MYLSEITDRNIESVDKVCKVLSVLNQGLSVTIDGLEFKIAELSSGGFGIVHVVNAYNTQEPNKCIKKVLGVSFEIFIRYVNKMTDEEMTILSANKVLNQLKK